MGCTRREFVGLSAMAAALGLGACANLREQQPESSDAEQPQQPQVDLNEFEKLKLDEGAWKYDSTNDVYYQLGLVYCKTPVATAYQSLAIFVPGAYFSATAKGDTYTCTVNPDAKVGSFTPATAPVLMPINSGNLSPQASPTAYSYNGLDAYLKAGFVYVYAGFRGRSSGYESGSKDVYPGGAPWPVVDLKAAVRYLRYNASKLPFAPDRIFTFGFGAGGGVSALLGSAGDAEQYGTYLDKIGAATHDAEGNNLSDATFGSASWCPILSYDTADAAYEWNMGQYASEDTRADGTWTKLLSNDLAAAYASFVNGCDLRDSDDQALTLDETSGEVYADGTYYSYLLTELEDAAKAFFSGTAFPYTYTPQRLTTASFPGDPNLQSTGSGTTEVDAVTDDQATAEAAADAAAGASGSASSGDAASAPDAASSNNATAAGATPGTKVQSVVYGSAEEYVAALNGDSRWLTYNQSRGTVRISSVGDFVTHLKKPTKKVCAFDATDRSSYSNQLFGINDASSLHYSQQISELLAANQDTYATGSGWDAAYVTDWSGDLVRKDSLDNDMATRVKMFNPLFYLSGAYDGYGKATVAPHWRINSGLFQTDTSLCSEANLALALSHYDGVKDVAFTPVWGQGHVLAERTGTAQDNLIAWVEECCQ